MPETLLPNITQFIAQIDPFDKLPKSMLSALASSIKITYLHKDESIEQVAGSNEKYLYVVRTGAMEQRKLNGVLRAKLAPEDLFGFSLHQDEHCTDAKGYTVKAIDNTLLYLLPHSALLTLVKSHPECAQHFAFEAKIRLQSALDVVWSNKDKGLFVKRVADVANDDVVVVEHSDSIRAVAKAMCESPRPGCAVVFNQDVLVGIITDRDITARVVVNGLDGQLPISQVMTRNPLTVEPDELVLKAASLMMQHNISHIPVVSNNHLCGLLTKSQLVQNHRVQAIFLIEKIKCAQDIKTLIKLTAERQAIFEALVEGHVAADIIGKVMTMVLDAFTQQIIDLALITLGPAPCAFAWVVAGSGARNEVHILSDQDNALILSDEVTEQDKHYFQQLGRDVNQGLAECAYATCPDHYMAQISKWCQPLANWQHYYKTWVENADYARLMNLTVFLETRVVYGDVGLAQTLNTFLHHTVTSNRFFLRALVAKTTAVSPPLGIFNQQVLAKNGTAGDVLDIKKHVLNLIIDLARIYGLSVQSQALETQARFIAANAANQLSDSVLKDILGAYQFICQYRFNHQLTALKAGEVPTNQIDAATFGSFERKHLKDVFRIIENLQDVAKRTFSDELAD